MRLFSRALDPENVRLIEGTPQQRATARRERLQQQFAQAIVTRWDEIPMSRLVFSRYWIEDTETGNLYREFGGDPSYAEPVCAHYIRQDGTPIMLEPADPPSLDARAKRQAAKEARRRAKEAEAAARRAQMRAAAGLR